MSRTWFVCACVLGALSVSAGCQKPVNFPVSSEAQAAAKAGAAAAYDGNHDGKVDFFLFAAGDGRIDAIGYDRNGDGVVDERISLDAIPLATTRHVVLILDGYGYDVVKAYRDAGGLRLFHAPSRVIAPYPTLTDLCLEDALGFVPCRAFEAEYYDRRTNRLAGGNWDYLTGANEPYNRLLDYRAAAIWDAIGYLYPREVFGKELNDAKRKFDRAQGREFLAYFVSSAGISTAYGADGQRESLARLERLILQVLYESRGMVKFTLLADHGHSYAESRRVGMEEHLRKSGWRLTEKLRDPRDVAYVRFGLETYISFATNSPAALAADAVKCEGVELASYADGDAVALLSADGGKATIRRNSRGRYGYAPAAGDPLRLREILAKLKPDAEGFHDADETLAATAEHEYPAPLERLWRAHFALARNAPDVIVSLTDGWYSGKEGFAARVRVVSTHGGLNRNNSTTFLMSTIGPLPALMRSGDIPRHMKALTGRDWPGGK